MHRSKALLARLVPAAVSVLAGLAPTLLGPVAAARPGVDPVGGWPVRPEPEVLRGFDPPSDPYGPGHRGVDLSGTVGQAMHSALAGTVTYAGLLAGRGVIVVSHGLTRTTYEPVAASVRVGHAVAQGDRIGALELAGSHCFPAACLHWGWLRGDDYLEPLDLVGHQQRAPAPALRRAAADPGGRLPDCPSRVRGLPAAARPVPGRRGAGHPCPVALTSSGRIRPVPARQTRATRILLLIGIVVLAFNLRPAAVSVGPVLHDISSALAMTPTSAGVLTSLPVLAFAVFGALAPRIARTLGVHRTSFLALIGVVFGLALRSLTNSVPLFLLLSVVALGGMATANVLLPSLVKLHFPDRIGLLTSIYTTALAVGLTLASILTVPLSSALGSWRWGLMAWAVTAAVAALPWIGLVGHDQALEDRPRTVTLSDVARTRLGWAMALCFGLQSLQAYAVFGWFAQLYRDAGFSSATAGLLLGMITGISIPVAFVAPGLAARMPNQTWLFLGLLATYAAGYVGLLVAPAAGAWLWAALVGIGTGVFPVVLTLIGLRARTEGGTAALSGFTQSVGYLVSAIGPFGMGYLYEHTGGWNVPLICLLVLLVPLAAVSVYVSRPQHLENLLVRA